MELISLKDLDLSNKKVIIREDFNVPIDENCNITDNTKIIMCLPTIRYVLSKGASVILLSHLGRPKKNEDLSKYSLKNVAKELEKILNKKIKFIQGNWAEGFSLNAGEIALCENVRFFDGEEKNDENLSKKLARLADVFVMDAFACAHRSHSSTEGITHFIKEKAAGFLLEKEINSLSKILEAPKKPVLAIVGGAKISTKISVLNNLANKVDYLILGGGIANTFLKARGFNIGLSLYEKSFVKMAKNLLQSCNFKADNKKTYNKNAKILLPVDVVVSEREFKDSKGIFVKTDIKAKDVTNVLENDKILDIGDLSIKNYKNYINVSETILWNGPLGVFEDERFANATKKIALSVANSKAFSVVGGGDTIFAMEKFNIKKNISYVSTGGGAFLEFLEGKVLPGVLAVAKK